MKPELTQKITFEEFEDCIKQGVEQAMKECELTIGMTLKEAVKKQIPKKPVVYTDTRNLLDYYGNSCGTYEVNVFECPACGEYITDVDEPCLYAYCGECGQALDWSADNG